MSTVPTKHETKGEAAEGKAGDAKTGGIAGDGIAASRGEWSFAGDTAANFDAHVSKSVPLYYEGHKLVTDLSDYFVGNDSIVYEIGCSTAALTKKLAQHHASKKARFVGIEIEQDMADIAARNCAGLPSVEIRCGDATNYDFEKADLIVAYYTVQFVLPKHRQALVDRLYQALNWGGALLMFEKVRAPDARFQDMVSQAYVDFKLDNGYSPNEIVTKARSIRRVLEPFSTQGNIDMMKRAGFVDVMSVMKYLCFEGFVAIK
jgi:tRNA (cmo5U34)-methyltransferase